jgi:4-diphosphocytidyl-2-C-methyl-D-erythritol kinase
MNEIVIKAPAKINIGLNIINKREDGYHNLETLFYPVNLFDTITIKPADSLRFSTNSDFLASESDNIVLKAVWLLERECGKRINVDIYLEKHIPVGAGLGGGSSDGAAVLKALNKAYSFNINNNKLIALALELGSDVPFFISSKPALASSRGEILTPVNFSIPSPVLIVNPGIHISTKWAFQNIVPAKWKAGLFELAADKLNINDLKYFILNDFETVCLRQYPELKNIKDKLYAHGAQFALMSGSGSSFFGIFHTKSEAEGAQKYFNELNYFTFIHQEQ